MKKSCSEETDGIIGLCVIVILKFTEKVFVKSDIYCCNRNHNLLQESENLP